jgi:glycosyltransferase involved in cell wall biosynthesis
MSIEWIGDFKAPSGYGRACRADLRALIKAGVTPAVRIHQHDRTQMDLSKDAFWGPRVADLLSPQREHPDIVVWQETPEFYRPDPTCKNVARIEWETSKVVDYDHADDPTHNWVTQLNAMSEVWVASQFVADVLASSGVTTPLHVIPHPTDLETFCPGERRYIGGPPGKEANRGRFTALALFQWTARKAPEDLLTAWSRSSLGKREDCCLLLKTYGADFTDVTRIVQHISVFRQMLNIPGLVTNVYPITSLILEKDMPDMYRTADVFLSPSRGEGFNMPVAEGMACGVPAVFTNRTAHSEFAVGYPVECHAVPVTGMPHIPWYSAEQDWWQIDALDFVAKLEEAYADWKTGRLKELGVEARQAAEALHSDERVGSLLRERCEALSPQAV